MQSERKLIEKEIQALQSEKNRYENNFASCVLEKYKIANDLEQCDQRLTEMRSKLDTRDMDIEQELEKHDYDLKSFLRLDTNPRSYKDSTERDLDDNQPTSQGNHAPSRAPTTAAVDYP